MTGLSGPFPRNRCERGADNEPGNNESARGFPISEVWPMDFFLGLEFSTESCLCPGIGHFFVFSTGGRNVPSPCAERLDQLSGLRYPRCVLGRHLFSST